MNDNAHKKIGPLHFFTVTLWELDSDSYSGFRRRGLKALQVLGIVGRNFRDDQCLLRAASLSFTTILSFVPFFALAFAVLKGLGVQNKVEPFILDQVTAGSQETVDRIVTYINNTNMTSLGAVGLVTLLLTVITLFGNIEETFNVIWGVRETRTIYRKFSDYLSVAVSGPLLLLASTSVTTSLQSQHFMTWLMTRTYFGDLLLFGFRLVPYLTIWLALVFLYIFIPNTKVHFRSAFIGGVLAGTSWQMAQWGYIHFQVGVAKYNAIYGTLAVLPIFMVWIYTSWLIVLFGSEVVYAHQNIRTFRRELRGPCINHGQRELLSLTILQNIAAAFHRGEPPWSAVRLAEELDIPLRLVQEFLAGLATAGYICATAGEELAYQPARELEQISVRDVLQSLKNYGSSYRTTRTTGGERLLQEILARVDAGAADALGNLTLKDLVGEPPPTGPLPEKMSA
jgi:membrane protein